MDVKGKVFLQLFNKSKLRNGTKVFLQPNFFSVVKFKKLGFSAPLTVLTTEQNLTFVKTDFHVFKLKFHACKFKQVSILFMNTLYIYEK